MQLFRESFADASVPSRLQREGIRYKHLQCANPLISELLFRITDAYTRNICIVQIRMDGQQHYPTRPSLGLTPHFIAPKIPMNQS